MACLKGKSTPVPFVMRHPRIAIPLPDYERVFRVIYSVIDDHANTPHACIFFAIVGAAILEIKYKITATPVAGAAAFAVDGKSGIVSVFGEILDDEFVSTKDSFHCWVQSRGVAIDFMAPLFRESLKTYGHNIAVPRRMFQKPLHEMAPSIRELNGEGAFFLQPNPELTQELFTSFSRRLMNTDFANVCLAWYARPPKPLPTNMGMRDNEGNSYFLRPKGPALEGVW